MGDIDCAPRHASPSVRAGRASPESAGSAWVGREISHWVATKPVDRILLVVTNGTLVWDGASGDFDPEASTAVHPALSGVFSDEPRFIDVSWLAHGGQVDRRDGRFQDALAEIAAPLHGVAKDEIAGEDVRQHRWTMRTAKLGVAALAVLTVLAVAAGVVAETQRGEARSQRDEATAQRNEAETQRGEADTQRNEAETLNRPGIRGGSRPLKEDESDGFEEQQVGGHVTSVQR